MASKRNAELETGCSGDQDTEIVVRSHPGLTSENLMKTNNK